MDEWGSWSDRPLRKQANLLVASKYWQMLTYGYAVIQKKKTTEEMTNIIGSFCCQAAAFLHTYYWCCPVRRPALCKDSTRKSGRRGLGRTLLETSLNLQNTTKKIHPETLFLLATVLLGPGETTHSELLGTERVKKKNCLQSKTSAVGNSSSTGAHDYDKDLSSLHW